MKKRTAIFLFSILFAVIAFAKNDNFKNNPENMIDTTQSIEAAEQWFFRAVSGYPAAISFEPVVLFANGDYYDVGEEPVDAVDKAADRKKRPAAWGTWKKTGETYLLTNYKRQSHDYHLGSGNWFPAYAYTSSSSLKKSYEKASGSDYGNGTVALTIRKITFTDDTHFRGGASTGISSPNAAGGTKSSNGGTYKITGHTIELTMSSGEVVKKSFAVGAKGSPAKPSTNIIFIGGDAYTDTDD